MPKLSPAAQAILSAYHEEAMDYIEEWGSFKHKRGMAAALRAAADCIVPGKLLADNLEESIAGRERFLVYQKLLAIAAELNRTNPIEPKN